MVQRLDLYIAENLFRRQVKAAFDSLPSSFLTGSKTYDPGNINNGAQATTTVTVANAALGDFAIPAFSLDTQGVVLTAQITSSGTATVTFRNGTGGAVDLDEGTLSVAVLVA